MCVTQEFCIMANRERVTKLRRTHVESQKNNTFALYSFGANAISFCQFFFFFSIFFGHNDVAKIHHYSLPVPLSSSSSSSASLLFQLKFITLLSYAFNRLVLFYVLFSESFVGRNAQRKCHTTDSLYV